MSLPIKWSPASKDEFAVLLDYVETEFGQDAALNLLHKTDKVLDGISEHPAMFPASEKSPSVRKALIANQTSLFYRISAKESGMFLSTRNFIRRPFQPGSIGPVTGSKQKPGLAIYLLL